METIHETGTATRRVDYHFSLMDLKREQKAN